ncbi:MAG: hypothetical protein H7Y36_09420 [Armatimonadetes bacterium]|nr:hypothetical protein [Akkermansiaceae bacterium]
MKRYTQTHKPPIKGITKFYRAYQTKDTPQKPAAKSSRFTAVIFILIILLIPGVAALALRSRTPAKTTPNTPAAEALMPAPGDQEKATKDSKVALTCIATFFSSSQDLMRLASLRPYPDLATTYQSHKTEIATLAAASPTPGGNLKRQGNFIGIPITFTGHPARLAWVELRAETARLDLDSLLGIGDVAWEKLDDAPAGKNIFLRGTLGRNTDKLSQLHFVSPDTGKTIILTGAPPDDLNTPRPARVTISKTPETPIVLAGWKLVKFHGWDWLDAE